MSHQLLASSRCIPSLQTALDGCPCCRRALFVQLSDPSSSISISDGSRSPAGAGRCPSVQPGQASPASWECVQAACPAHSSAGCILNRAHSTTEILPKAAALAAHSPSQGLSLCPDPITALSWAGPVSLGLCCSLQWDSCFPSLF